MPAGDDEAPTQPEAMACLALAAVASDGVITPEEEGGLTVALARMQLYRAMGRDQMEVVMTRCVDLLRRHGADGLMRLAGEALAPELRATAFAVATDLVLADGAVSAAERRLLEDLRGVLDVDPELAHRIVEVLAIKNMG